MEKEIETKGGKGGRKQRKRRHSGAGRGETRDKKENRIICPDIRSVEYLTSCPDARISGKCIVVVAQAPPLIRNAAHWRFSTLLVPSFSLLPISPKTLCPCLFTDALYLVFLFVHPFPPFTPDPAPSAVPSLAGRHPIFSSFLHVVGRPRS